MRSTRTAVAGLFFCLSLQVLTACTTEEPLTPLPPASQPSAPATAPASSLAGTAMPDVVGIRLSEAREQLSALGYQTIEEVDVAGGGRPVVDSVNWVVVAQSPPAGSSAAPTAQITLEVRKPTDTTETPAGQDGVVPDVVCLDLQAAQDAMQAAGFFNLRSEDSSGQDRRQLADRNWVVVNQSVAAGIRPDALAVITLGAVKFGEPTGASGCQS